MEAGEDRVRIDRILLIIGLITGLALLDRLVNTAAIPSFSIKGFMMTFTMIRGWITTDLMITLVLYALATVFNPKGTITSLGNLAYVISMTTILIYYTALAINTYDQLFQRYAPYFVLTGFLVIVYAIIHFIRPTAK